MVQKIKTNETKSEAALQQKLLYSRRCFTRYSKKISRENLKHDKRVAVKS